MSRQPVRSSGGGRSGQPFWFVGAAVLAVIAGILFFLKFRSGSTRSGSDSASGLPPLASAGPVGAEPDGLVYQGYAGSESCRSCHEAVYKRWTGSNHQLAERKVGSELDSEAVKSPLPRKFRSLGQPLEFKNDAIEIHGIPSSPAGDGPAIARHVIGHNPLRQLLVEVGGGRVQAFDMAFDPARKEWFSVFGSDERQPGEWGHWTGRGMNWNSMCASCHNTRLRKHYDPANDSYHTTRAEMSIGCEACHGPMKRHAEWRRLHSSRPEAEPAHQPFSRDQAFDTCGSCHARRAEITGDFRPGDSFNDHFALTLVDGTDQYFADGQVHDENYEYGSFLSSRMHAGGVRCVDCHDPHSAGLKVPGNALCMQCHSGGNPGFPKSPRIDPAAHSGHSLAGGGQDCVSCHMPVAVFMQRHPRHDHGFTIPDPLLTRELGIPNACAKCHSTWTAERLIAGADKIFGRRLERSTRQRTRVIAAARRNQTESGRQLLAIASDARESSYWRAVAVRMLGGWAGDRSVRGRIAAMATDANPLVRSSVVQSLEPWVQSDGEEPAVIGRMLLDPSRSVRVRAAWVLRRDLDLQSVAGREMMHFLESNADQPGGRLQQSVFAMDRGETGQALVHARAAAGWDSHSAAARHELAVILSLAGKPVEAVAALKEAVKLEPDESEYHYKLALALHEAGEPQKALQALENVVSRFPTHDRAWYNLGLSRQAAGDQAGGIEALLRAESIVPADPRIPYARGTILMQSGDVVGARRALERVLEIDPGHSEARDLLSRLPR